MSAGTLKNTAKGGMKDADERSAQSLDQIIETISGDKK